MEKENNYTEIDHNQEFWRLCVGNGKSSGAFGFALIFLLLFLSRKKVNKEHASAQNEIPLNGLI